VSHILTRVQTVHHCSIAAAAAAHAAPNDQAPVGRKRTQGTGSVDCAVVAGVMNDGNYATGRAWSAQSVGQTEEDSCNAMTGWAPQNAVLAQEHTIPCCETGYNLSCPQTPTNASGDWKGSQACAVWTLRNLWKSGGDVLQECWVSTAASLDGRAEGCQPPAWMHGGRL